MKKTLLWLLLPAFCILVPTLANPQAVANKQQVLGQARNAYYNLRDEGLMEFACSVTPNWEALLAKKHEATPERVDADTKTLNELQFTASLGTDGKVKLTHNDLSAQSEEKDALRKMYGGMEQMASEVFATWSMFMLDRPFPEVASEYQLEAPPGEYRLSYKYKNGGAPIVTTMGRDFVITNLQATIPQSESSTYQPRFTKNSKGFLLSAYDSSYKSASFNDATQLSVLISYQEVSGLQIIKQLNLSGTYGGSPFAVELAFSNCKVTKKP